MNNLWVFGDSFAYLHETGNTWPRQLAQHLNQHLRCYARGGTSLEYTYSEFNLMRSYFESNDTIVLALTEMNRRWLMRHIINENIWMLLKSDPDSATSNAIKHYLTYLENTSAHETYLANFLYNVAYVTKQKNLNTVILPCFESTSVAINKINPNLIVAQGNLFDISNNEFDPAFTNRHAIIDISDIRANHMVYSNHTILALKIADAIKHRTPIVLYKDFVQNILTQSNIRDCIFSKDELFDIHLDVTKWSLYQ